MSVDWPRTKLQEICTKIGSGATPRGGKESYKEAGTSLIRSQNVYNHGFSCDGLAFIDDEQAAGLDNVIIERHDVLINITGESVCRSGQVPDDILPARVNQHVMIVRPDPARLDPKFLRYFVITPETQAHLNALSSAGATRRALTKSMIESLSVPIPPLQEQRAIASILGALDDKIELNRRMNATLESLARAIFKSWFVDFDPVRRNAAKVEERSGKTENSNSDHSTFTLHDSLFPSSFQDSDLGKIPTGWVVGTVGDIGDNQRRSIKPDEIDAETPHIALEHMPRRSISLDAWETNEKIGSNKYSFNAGEILFGKLRPYFHKVGVPAISGVCSTDILVVAPKEAYHFGYLLGHMSSDDLIVFTNQASTGTKMPRTNWKDISAFKIVIPPKKVLASYSKLMSRIVSKIHSHIHESSTLSALRDTLLPKLLSGELPVPPALKATHL